MALFVIRPDPDAVSTRSHAFMLEECQRSENGLKDAERRLEYLEEKYEDDGNWEHTFALGKAEENFENAKRVHDANLLKLGWESRGEWKRRIKVPRGRMVTPWRHDLKNWLNIFKRK